MWAWIKGIWGGLTGGWWGAIGTGLKLADDVVRETHDKGQQAAGAAAQREVMDAEVVKGVMGGNQAASSPDVIGLVRERDQVP